MAPQERSKIPLAPITESSGDVSNSPQKVAIPMEYEPVRYGNSLHAKAVTLAQKANPDISFEEGESALEKLGLRHQILCKKTCMDDLEPNSKEFYSGLCEKTLIEARGWFDKAEQALFRAHIAMWSVYRSAIQAVDAPSVSPEEYHRQLIARRERTSQEAREWLQAQEWKKIADQKKEGCKCFDDQPPGGTPTATRVEKSWFVADGEAANGAVTTSPGHAGKGLEQGDACSAGATGGSSKTGQGTGIEKRKLEEKSGEVESTVSTKRRKK